MTYFPYYLLQLIVLTIAPAFIMGGIYFLLGQLVIIHGRQFSVLKPLWYAYIFIACDITSLVIQAIGVELLAEKDVRLLSLGSFFSHYCRFVRCIYRVVELAQGFSGYLITHEVYIMLDALMLFIALYMFIPFHPHIVFGASNIIRLGDIKGNTDEKIERKYYTS
ncbi:unnamed protein product [Candida parapsilosis]